MRLHLTIIVLSIFLISCTHYDIKNDIKNRITEKHVLIPGTRLYLITTKKPYLKDDAIVLQINNEINLKIQDFINENYFKHSVNINTDTFKKYHAEIILFKKFYINSYNAKFSIIEKKDLKVRIFTLMFGNQNFCVTLFCKYPNNRKDVENEIINTSLSVIYDKNIKVNPFYYSSFYLNTDSTDFILHKNTITKYYFTSSVNPETDSNFSFFLIKQLSIDNCDYNSLQVIMNNSMEFDKKSYKIDFINNIKSIKLNRNNVNSIETSGFSMIENKNVLLYYFVVGKNDNAIMLEAFIPIKYKNHLKQIRKIAYSITLK